MSATTEFTDLFESVADELPCRNSADPDAWFAEPGSKRQERAITACLDCPIFEQCHVYALTEGVPDGVWGGRNEADRRLIWQGMGGRPTKFLDDIDAALELHAPINHAQPDDEFGDDEEAA